MKVVQAKKSDLDSFFLYLEHQLSENGQDQFPLFMPISKNINELSDSTKDKFSNGASIEFGNIGWRKLWVVIDSAGVVKGHVDLRHHDDIALSNRVLLGMGVDSSYRKKGIGKTLIDTVLDYCQANQWIDFLDLSVLSSNLAAKSLYVKSGFTVEDEVYAHHCIDGENITESSMTIRVKDQL